MVTGQMGVDEGVTVFLRCLRMELLALERGVLSGGSSVLGLAGLLCEVL